jgi:hypothetical protein
MPKCEWSNRHKAWVKECTQCRKIYVGHKDREKAKLVLRGYFSTNPDRGDGLYSSCNRCGAEKLIHARYGITRPEALAKLGNACGICDEAFNLNSSTGEFFPNMDHDHKTWGFRGLLCRPCNVTLGLYENFYSTGRPGKVRRSDIRWLNDRAAWLKLAERYLATAVKADHYLATAVNL